MPSKTPISVDDFMLELTHPLKELCNTVRDFIKSTDTKIQERIKWNAPSYYSSEDFLTFNFNKKDALLLIFHHPHIDNLQSVIFDSKPKGRAIVLLKSEEDFIEKSETIRGIILDLLQAIHSNE